MFDLWPSMVKLMAERSVCAPLHGLIYSVNIFAVMKSLEFFLNTCSVIRKKFHQVQSLVNGCLSYFNCAVLNAICRRKIRFLTKIKHSDNLQCRSFVTSKDCWWNHYCTAVSVLVTVGHYRVYSFVVLVVSPSFYVMFCCHLYGDNDDYYSKLH